MRGARRKLLEGRSRQRQVHARVDRSPLANVVRQPQKLSSKIEEAGIDLGYTQAFFKLVLRSYPMAKATLCQSTRPATAASALIRFLVGGGPRV
jgi:hypothetical protein